MAEKPQAVSVIVATYNRAHLLGRTIIGMLNRMHQDFEVLLDQEDRCQKRRR